jgi:nitrate reductase NapE
MDPGARLPTSRDDTSFDQPAVRRRRELLMFLFLTVVLWPAIAVAFVGSWGLAVWLYQALTGHPSL